MYGDSREFDSFTGQSSFANQLPAPIDWFNSLLAARFRNANCYSAITTGFLFYLAVAFYQTSVFHPLESILNLLYLFFFPTFWFGEICVVVLGYFLSWFFISKCFHALYEMNYNIAKFQVVTAMLGMLSSYLLVWFFVICASLTTVYSSWTTFALFASTAFFTSYQTALSTNFRWRCTKAGVFGVLRSGWSSLLNRSAGDLARNVARGYMLATPLCVLFPALRHNFFDLIFAFKTNISNFFLVFILQIGIRLILESINLVAMQPVNLPLTSQTVGTGRQTRQQQNLINAITSENDLLREFGFSALNELARGSRNSREVIFSLSQPGKKPRNWLIIYEVCTRITDATRDMLQASTSFVETQLGDERTTNIARLGLNLRPANTPTIRPMARRQFDYDHSNGGLRNTSSGSPNGHDVYHLNQSKHRLLQPPQLNPRVQCSSYRPRIFYADLTVFPGYSYIGHWVTAFRSTFLRPTPSVSSYYLKLSEYCLDTLSVLAAYSLDEDSFGIVQQHLSPIISTFLRLELAIDLYIRSTSNNKAEHVVREHLHSLEEVLEHALKQLYIPFRKHIDALNLSESERKLLTLLTSDLYNVT